MLQQDWSPTINLPLVHKNISLPGHLSSSYGRTHMKWATDSSFGQCTRISLAICILADGEIATMQPPEEGIGYGRLASKLALENDLCIFRHFAELNIRNILYLQSELQELELKLRQLDVKANDNTNEPSQWSMPRSYHYASRTKATAPDGDDTYWSTVLRIREVLEGYSILPCPISSLPVATCRRNLTC